MNIVFFSNIFFTDCDFSLVRQYQISGHEVLYYISLVEGRSMGGLLRLDDSKIPMGITCAINYEEFAPFKDFIDLNKVFLVKSPRSLFRFEHFKICFALIKQIKKFSPKVLHTSESLGFSKIPLYLFKRIMVLTVHDPFMHSGEYTYSSELKRRISFKWSNKLILLNKTQKSEFIKKYNLKNKRICIGRLGVYDALNCLKSNANDFADIQYVLFFGHISPYKGVDLLLESMVKVHDVLPNVHCVIAGKGSFNFDIKPYQALDYIHFENRFIPTVELTNLISNSLFAICPYKDATQSGVVASAFALAKPVLATNVGGLGESVIDGVTGRLIEPNKTDQLTTAIINMANNQDKLETYSINIRNLFWEGEKSWTAIADNYLNFYES